MLDMDRFRRGGSRLGGGGGGGSRSLRSERSPNRSPGGSRVVAPGVRPRGSVVGDLLLSPERPRGEGNIQTKRQACNLRVESGGKIKTPTPHEARVSSKKFSGMPIKILMDEEMQKHAESRRHSPSVIAKLMGLDPLPARQPCNMQKKETVVPFHKGSSQGFVGKHMSYEQRKQEFKDVFEVLETRAADKSNWHALKGSLNSRQRDKERQKFVGAKRLSTDEKLKKSEEFGPALEVLDSNKDLFLKFLDEPTSLFKKHLRDLDSVTATPEASHITILRSSNVPRYETSELCQKLGRKSERNTSVRSVMQTPETDIFVHCLKEHTLSHSRNLSISKHEAKTEESSLPTRIVVLKPSLDNVQKSAKIHGTSESFQLHSLGYRSRDSRRSGSLELFSELRERQKLSDDVEVARWRTGSREIAKEVRNRMWHNGAGDCEKYDSRYSMLPEQGYLNRMPGSATHTESEALRQISSHVDGCNNSYSSLSETYSSGEARKHLSDRWTMNHRSQEVGVAGCGLSTLGEMLALSDRETQDVDSCSLHVKYSGKELPTKWTCPSGISSRDGWKGGCSGGLPRSKSVPASSTIRGSPSSIHTSGTHHTDSPFTLKEMMNFGSRDFPVENLFTPRLVSPCRDVNICLSSSQLSNSDEVESKLPVREIHVDQDKLMNGLDSKIGLVQNALSESSTCDISDTTFVIECVPVAHDTSGELSLPTSEQQLAQSFGSCAPAVDECSPASYDKEFVAKDTSGNQSLADSHLSHTCLTGDACSMISKEVEQPSPVSVLEPPDENEYSPESFERVSANLQELRMQLNLLKLESRQTYADKVVSIEDACGEISDVPKSGGVPPTLRSEEDRDLSYVLHVLRDSGFHNSGGDTLFSVFYTPDSPVCPDAFEKLEKIYSGVPWSRSERKLLFDSVNSVLADIIALNMDVHPGVKPRIRGLIGCQKGLTEEVWQSLVRQRTQVFGDASGEFMDSIRWLDLTDDMDSVGKEIERMLKDDLLEELVSEIFSVGLRR